MHDGQVIRQIRRAGKQVRRLAGGQVRRWWWTGGQVGRHAYRAGKVGRWAFWQNRQFCRLGLQVRWAGGQVGSCRRALDSQADGQAGFCACGQAVRMTHFHGAIITAPSNDAVKYKANPSQTNHRSIG